MNKRLKWSLEEGSGIMWYKLMLAMAVIGYILLAIVFVLLATVK